MSEGGYGVKKEGKLMNWEKNSFPIACDKCLGPQKYMRMLKKPLGMECKVCDRPYTSFHWKIGNNPRFKKTQICSTCAKINNCCQVCIYDLEFGLPIDIRNRLMGNQKVELMTSEGNRDMFAALMDENVDKLKLPYKKANETIKEIIKPINEESGEEELGNAVEVYRDENLLDKRGDNETALFDKYVNEISKDDVNEIEIRGRRFNSLQNYNKQEDYSNYKNLAKYCSFWLKGECKRGDLCTYIHAEPPKIRRRNPRFDIKNRYLGVEDPDQKLSLDGMLKARERLNKMGYLENEVLVYYVENAEVDEVLNKIKKFLGDDIKHEFREDKMGLRLIFRDREKAEWCMKLFKKNFTVNGKLLNFKWIKDKPKPKRNKQGQILNEDGTVNEDAIEKKEEKKRSS